MCLERAYYIAGIVSAVAAIVGLVGLWYYARETHALRKATEAQLSVAREQFEGVTRPCVVVVKNPDIQGGFDENHLLLKNLGSGVALNIRYQLLKNKGGPWIEAPALSAGGEHESHMNIRHLLNLNPLVCEFESLGGTGYRTESFISESTTDFDLRHKLTKISTEVSNP